MNKNILIIGQGKIGSQVSNQLTKRGFTTTGMARGKKKNYHLDAKVHYIQADATKITAQRLSDFTHICIIVSPSFSAGKVGVDVYRSTYLAIAEHIASIKSQLTTLERLVFISSTGVYGQDNGEWIDENTVIQAPNRESSNIILLAEQVLQHAFTSKCVIIRPSGIYGIGRLMRVRKAKENNKVAMPMSAWTNRVLDSDLVNIIVNVLIINKTKPMYLATDYQPVTSFVLTGWLSKHLKSEMPTIDDSLPTSGKRIHSNIPLEWFRYPDWQCGYKMVLRSIV